jgi:hypothetical protein
MGRLAVVTTRRAIASVADARGVLRAARTGAELLGDAGGTDVEIIHLLAKTVRS